MKLFKAAAIVLGVSLLAGCTAEQKHRYIVHIPADTASRETLFLKKELRIDMAKCGWMGDIAIFTGEKPAIASGGSIEALKDTKLIDDGYTYTGTFNRGTLRIYYDMKKQSGLLQHGGGERFSRCAWTSIQRNYPMGG